jgi:hypothetical protein
MGGSSQLKPRCYTKYNKMHARYLVQMERDIEAWKENGGDSWKDLVAQTKV